jgi:rsbT co-antagonist protein RsbR
MLWHNLRLQHRMLLGYGLMLVLIIALALFSMIRASGQTSQIQTLGAEVTNDVEASSELVNAVTSTQLAVDRYLQQPTSDHLGMASVALQQLSNTINETQVTLSSGEQQVRLNQLSQQLDEYEAAFQTLTKQLADQQAMRTTLNGNLSEVVVTLNSTTIAYLNSGDPDVATMGRFTRAQQHLQRAILWSARLISESKDEHGRQALNELHEADFLVGFELERVNQQTKLAITQVLSKTASATETLNSYMATLEPIQQQRTLLVNELGSRLQSQANQIGSMALEQLNRTTEELEYQSTLTQQLTASALLLTIVIAAIFGWVLPKTMTRPLLSLVSATKQLTKGDYGVVVDIRDGSEIGELAKAFNQTSMALLEQREEVARQQAALQAQNAELQQTLAELHASTEARAQMAVTIRALSVPVISILDRVLLLPLVGEIDAERGKMLLDRLLEGVTNQHARIVILDITGVPVVDITLVDWLLKATWAARLMGARCILVGIGPEVAQAIVASGADLSDLMTKADLRSAVEYAVRNRNW